MPENMDQKNSKYEHFSYIDNYWAFVSKSTHENVRKFLGGIEMNHCTKMGLIQIQFSMLWFKYNYL